MRAPMALPANPLKRWLRLTCGTLLMRIFPRRTARLEKGEVEGELNTRDYLILTVLGQQALRSGRIQELHAVHRKFWTTHEAADGILRAHWRYQKMFLDHHARIVEPLREAVRSLGCRRLIEIGSGGGDVLHHIGGAMPELTSLCGIDLNPMMVEESRRRWSDPRLSFQAGDGFALLKPLATPPCAVLTNGGVLEFWPQARVAELFSWLVDHARPCVMALVEPLHDDHRLDREPDSRPYGEELSLSHNYPKLLLAAGFEIGWREEVRTGPQRWIMLVAVRR